MPKRLLDIVVCIASLVVLAPLLLLIGALIRVFMGSPVLFRQERPGVKRRAFTLVKCRTMRHAIDNDANQLPDGARLTRLGRFLRGASLDELPQLWNVLRGEMSLVGPRPLLMKYVPLYSAAHRRFNPANLAPDVRRNVRAQRGIPEEALVVGFVGRIVRDNGLVELVGAWREPRERCPSLHLLIVGPIESQDQLPAEVAQVLRTDSRIHLVGLEWNTPPLYAAMDLLVLPTYREGFPTVPLEAGAMELPVVATSVPGCTDAVVDGETGLLAEPRDVASLTDRISAYVVDPERRRRNGRAGRERVLREFRQELIWEAAWQEYARLLTEAGRPLVARMLRPDAGEPTQLAPECA